MTEQSNRSRKLKCSDINIALIFKQLDDQIYTIIKGEPEMLPLYYPGADIDIFCYQLDKFGQKLLSILSDFISARFQIKVTDIEKHHTQVDILESSQIHLRFDLYGAMPYYPGIEIRDALFLSIIENSIPLTKKAGDISFTIWKPSEVDDLLIRYLEYVAFYEQRPDKLKHLEYILSKVEENSKRIGFLDKLHKYTDLPKCTIYKPPESAYPKRTIIEKIKRFMIKIMRLVLPESKVMELRQSYSSLKKKLLKRRINN